MKSLKIILSPAKRMRSCVEEPVPTALPVYLKRTEKLLKRLQAMSRCELKALWSCSDAIADLNCERLSRMNLYQNLSAALVSFDGILYQYMAPQVFEESYYEYVQDHLRILSGFYGILKPLDGVTPYRLEMQAPLETEEGKNLYEFWKETLYSELVRGGSPSVILNLASAEYYKCIKPYLRPEDTCITCIFGQWENNRVREKGVYVKMARGEMVRYLAEHHAEDPAEAKNFDRLGFCYHGELSDENRYVFLMET